MIDLASAAAVSRAATRAHELLTAQIVAEPSNPIVAELQRIAAQLQALVKDNAQLIESLERRTR